MLLRDPSLNGAVTNNSQSWSRIYRQPLTILAQTDVYIRPIVRKAGYSIHGSFLWNRVRLFRDRISGNQPNRLSGPCYKEVRLCGIYTIRVSHSVDFFGSNPLGTSQRGLLVVKRYRRGHRSLKTKFSKMFFEKIYKLRAYSPPPPAYRRYKENSLLTAAALAAERME
jgi:hypothetical protein